MSSQNPASDPQEQEETQQVTLFSSPPPQSTDEQHQSNSPTPHFQQLNRQIGVRQWFNNKKLSDIIIRYGDQGQNIFHGHKVILASSSIWFQTAFTSPHFIESKSREITLEGDDEESLMTMLQSCYLPNNAYPPMPSWPPEQAKASKNSNKYTLYHVSIYSLADKYDVPKLREQAAAHVKRFLQATFAFAPNLPNTHILQIVGLRGIIDKIYEITGHWDLNDPLRKAVLDVLMGDAATKPVGANKPGVLTAEVLKAAEQIPDFGRDMFLRTVGKVPAGATLKTYLDVVEEVTCPNCQRVWAKVATYSTVRCAYCGIMHKWK